MAGGCLYERLVGLKCRAQKNGKSKWSEAEIISYVGSSSYMIKFRSGRVEQKHLDDLIVAEEDEQQQQQPEREVEAANNFDEKTNDSDKTKRPVDRLAKQRSSLSDLNDTLQIYLDMVFDGENEHMQTKATTSHIDDGASDILDETEQELMDYDAIDYKGWIGRDVRAVYKKNKNFYEAVIIDYEGFKYFTIQFKKNKTIQHHTSVNDIQLIDEEAENLYYQSLKLREARAAAIAANNKNAASPPSPRGKASKRSLSRKKFNIFNRPRGESTTSSTVTSTTNNSTNSIETTSSRSSIMSLKKTIQSFISRISIPY